MKIFCIVIQKPLVLAHCPLPKGACTWQHRETNFCKYTGKDLTVGQHAALVGLPEPTTKEVTQTESILITELRRELT